MDLLSLPQELIDNVLDHAAEELPRRDVHSLILVCRAFVRRLQLHLFRYITLGKPADCEAWTQRHHASPSLGEHVRHMGISHYEGLRPGPDTSLWTGLHELLLTCPNIKNLSIQAVDLDSIQGTQDWPRILKAVERLWLTSCCCSYATFRSAVLGLPLLNELTLTRVKIINLDGDHPPQTSNIQRLSVSTKGMPSVDRTRLGVLLGTSLSRLIGLTVEVTFDEDNSFASELVKRTAGTIEFLRIHHTMLFMLPENCKLMLPLLYVGTDIVDTQRR